MSFVYCNVHPKGLKVGDCVKRAITKTTGKEYMEVQRDLNRYKKKTGTSKFNNRDNWAPYLEKELGATPIKMTPQKGEKRFDGFTFPKAFPKGKYILQMSHHLTCCIDGVIYDTWDCRDKCIYKAWRIGDEGTLIPLQRPSRVRIEL